LKRKTQLIQYLKQFPSIVLVERLLDWFKAGYTHFKIEEEDSGVVAIVDEWQQTLLLQMHNTPIFVHRIVEQKHSIELLLRKEDAHQLLQLKKFVPYKKKINNQTVGRATFVLSKDLLNHQEIQKGWLKALAILWQQPSTTSKSSNRHNPWVYRLAMDNKLRLEAIQALEKRNKYQAILAKAVEQLLMEGRIQQIQKAETFWLAKAQAALAKLEGLSVNKLVGTQALQDYEQSNKRFDSFVKVAQLTNKPYATLLETMGQLVAYIDNKATAKQQWNDYKDKRTIAQTGVRQHLWVKQLLAYKQAANNLEAITTTAIKNALLYLKYPAEQTAILSMAHQRQIANHLLDTTYRLAHFNLQLISYFNQFDISVQNYQNYTYLLRELLYSDSIKELWKYTEEDLYQDELIAKSIAEPLSDYQRMKESDFPLNQVLYGPPGTGKTFDSIRRAVAVVENKAYPLVQQMDAYTIQHRLETYIDLGRIVFTTFHQSMAYEDFVEGIKPTVVDGQVHYQVHDGLLKALARQATKERQSNFVLIIDEINRGNVANILGELITVLEEDKRLAANHALKVKLPYSKEWFGLPPNLYVIATMNTIDRSTEQLDMALRRRFTFVERQADSMLLSEDIDGINLRAMHQCINERITILLDKEHQIGHAYFMTINNLADLQAVFQNQIIPLLLEYFYGDYGKLGLVLGPAFVHKKTFPFSKLADFDYEGMQHNWDEAVYEMVDFPVDKTAFEAIYQK